MVYEREKIKRLIEYKDRSINEQKKEDLEWLIEQYNKYFIADNDFEYMKYTYGKTMKKYYDVEDDKLKMKKDMELLKRKYNVLRNNYNELLLLYKDSCKKNEKMI